MEKDKINLFLAMNAEKFSPAHLSVIRKDLETMDENQYMIVNSMEYQNPTIIFVIALLLGWERFFLGDIAMGVLKLLTCGGCLIWWLVDLFTAKRRAQEYNFKKYQQASMM